MKIGQQCDDCKHYFGHAPLCRNNPQNQKKADPEGLEKLCLALLGRHPTRVQAMIALLPASEQAELAHKMNDMDIKWAHCEACDCFSPILQGDVEIRTWTREHGRTTSHKTLFTSWLTERNAGESE